MKNLFSNCFIFFLAILLYAACTPDFDAVDLYDLRDGQYYQYLTKDATVNKGADIVIMGDGFTEADLMSGAYQNAMKTAAEALFSVQPYKAYRGYFNVFIVGALSEARGISDPHVSRNTKFKATYLEEVPNTGMNADMGLCFDYAKRVPIEGINTTLVILVTNSTRYGGTCYFSSAGWAFAVCPMSTSNYPYDFQSIVRHEAGGHGFAKLADEYISAETAATRSRNDIPFWHGYGYYANVDLTNDPAKMLWRDFLGHTKYSMVGAYEGAYYFDTGVWRPESGSCMINNISYFNAPSRAAIVKRICALTGRSFSLQDFINKDIIEPAPVTKTGVAERLMPPLPPPVGIVE